MIHARWGWVFILIALGIFAAVVWHSPAWPQQPRFCAPRTMLLAKLKADFKEEPAYSAMAGESTMVEVTVSPDGNWTLFTVNAHGLACILIGGKDWTSGPAGEDA